MLLNQLFENMATTALDQLIYNSNRMAVLYLDTLPAMVRNLYAEGYHEDMKRTVSKVVGQQKGKWFAENFLSTSSGRTNPTAGMKNALVSLSKDTRYAPVRGKLKELGGLEINMDINMRNANGISFGKHMNALESLPSLLKALVPNAPIDFQERLKIASVKLENAINSFYSLWSKLHTVWDNEWGAAADVNKEQAETKKVKQSSQQMNGAQLSQADLIINQVLSSLDKKVAHEIRTTIARSDNKLIALQQELTKRHINM